MSDEDKNAIEQLERRVATLENMVRRLTFVAGTADQARLPSVQPHATPPPAATPPGAAAPPALPRISARTDLEQWFGQRGLLAVGVAALLIAAAFFLKYAFDRGWVSPPVRSTGAIVLGIAVAAWGHERIGRGMRRYGAAMIGAGGGLAYLGLWAAAGPYALMERRLGIVLLATTTVAVTLLALHHELEGLALWALSGAYLAPLILPTAPNPVGFLGYLEVIGLGTALLAYGMSWRATFNLALLGYLLLASAGAADAVATPLGCWLIAAGVLLTLEVTWRRPWPEARVIVPLIAWPILGAGLIRLAGPPSQRWLALAAAFAVTAALWWQHVRRDPFASRVANGADISDVAVDRLLFLLNPLAFLILAATAQLSLLRDSYQVVPAALAAAYLAAGWVRRSASQLITAFVLAAVAVAFAWSAAATTAGWAALILLALAAERHGARPGGRHAAVALAAAAWLWHFAIALDMRASLAPVFIDPWALALYGYIAAAAIAARWWGQDGTPAATMWTLAGSALFLGGSVQFHEYFRRMTALAGDLALSVWWLLFAGALVLAGFQLNRKRVRAAGLAVAALAGSKIVLVDLSNLEALYRVASFFALALIALAVAYGYNTRAKASAG